MNADRLEPMHGPVFDAHMHVGEFPLFDVRLDRDGLVDLMEAGGIDTCLVFHPDNGYVREVVESVPGAYALVWVNPRLAGYLETSGMPMHTKIREAVERVGPDRVLYGSDAPFHHPEVEIRKVQVSGLTPELVERVLSRNGRALFFGDERAQTPVHRARHSEQGGR